MKVLIVGNGGREHALTYAISGYRGVEIHATRPNAGIAGLARAVDIAPGDIDALAAFAKDQAIDLTVVGPEAPLAAGIVDRFKAGGLRAFGPSGAAAMLETSKAFAHRVMDEAGVPSAAWQEFSDYEAAVKYCEAQEYPLVVKADGLAAGKGVTIAPDFDTADRALRTAMKDRQFGDSGSRVVVEEFLKGREMSFMAISDGQRVLPLPMSKDHKQVFDGNKGPNTGGMGAISPVPFANATRQQEIVDTVIQPVIDWMRDYGTPFQGVLYAGLMDTAQGIRVLEFNVRFGDPETQALLPRLHGDLIEALMGAAEGDISGIRLSQSKLSSVVVVMASKGYPGAYEKDLEIKGLDSIADPLTYVFHAGTAMRDGRVVTSGGRVLGVMGMGESIEAARSRAYESVAKISFSGAHFRRDIGLVDI